MFKKIRYWYHVWKAIYFACGFFCKLSKASELTPRELFDTMKLMNYEEVVEWLESNLHLTPELEAEIEKAGDRFVSESWIVESLE